MPIHCTWVNSIYRDHDSLSIIFFSFFIFPWFLPDTLLLRLIPLLLIANIAMFLRRTSVLYQLFRLHISERSVITLALTLTLVLDYYYADLIFHSFTFFCSFFFFSNLIQMLVPRINKDFIDSSVCPWWRLWLMTFLYE